MEVVRELEEVGEGVEFVFALEDEGVFVRGVDGVAVALGGGVEPAGGRGLEGVAVGGADDVFGLGVYGAENEFVDLFILLREGLVLGELVRGVSEPLCVDVAGDDEALGALPGVGVPGALALFLLDGAVGVPADCCVEGVWEGVFEDLGEVLVDELVVHVLNDLLDERRLKGAAVLGGALGGQFERALAVGRTASRSMACSRGPSRGLLLAHGIVLVVRTCCFVLEGVDGRLERFLDVGADGCARGQEPQRPGAVGSHGAEVEVEVEVGVGELSRGRLEMGWVARHEECSAAARSGNCLAKTGHSQWVAGCMDLSLDNLSQRAVWDNGRVDRVS